MAEASDREQAAPEYILVALDASPHSEAALAAAAELATALHLELRGLFVEDIDLLHLCGLPFGLEIGSFTATPRRLEQTYLEREFRVQATSLRKIMADVAGQRRLAWSFQVVRGTVADQLLEAAASARMVSLGRVGRSPGKRLGSTARTVARNTKHPVVIQSASRRLSGPFTVVFTDTLASNNSLRLAAQLAHQDKSVLTILAVGDEATMGAIGVQLADLSVEADVRILDTWPGVLAELHKVEAGTVVLPVEAAHWLEETSMTVIVVP